MMRIIFILKQNRTSVNVTLHLRGLGRIHTTASRVSVTGVNQLMCSTNWLTNVDESNPLGIDIWYRMIRCFSILDGIETIWSVPKK